MELDAKFKELAQELGEAINDSLAESDKISDVLSRIRTAGYDLMLVLEVTIGYNKRKPARQALLEKPRAESGQSELLELNAHDARFLRALKITVEKSNT